MWRGSSIRFRGGDVTDHPLVLLSALTIAEARGFNVGGHEVVLCRTEDDVCCLDGICTHEDLPLDGGEVSAGVLTCPWHGARYDIRTGRVLALPATRPLRTYRTRIAEDGLVHVEIP